MTLFRFFLLVAFMGFNVSAVADEPVRASLSLQRSEGTLRLATFNVSMNRDKAGKLRDELKSSGSLQIQNIAEIIQRVAPDVILLNEFDDDPTGESIDLFRKNYLAKSWNGSTPIDYAYSYRAPSNTGMMTEFDLDKSGKLHEAGDAIGFGSFEGQYGMVILSKFPIDQDAVRTFQKFLWKDMPQPALPDNPATSEPSDWYAPQELAILRLSSKSHWDVPIRIKNKTIHFLAFHPTPPVFDGPEDRNGRRNHDEIRFWADYIAPGKGDYLVDDAGKKGGLPGESSFVILGDTNADNEDGDSFNHPLALLFSQPRIQTQPIPKSPGAKEASELQGSTNIKHKGDPAADTTDFGEPPGNLRVDYVLPSLDLIVAQSGVFWPAEADPLSRLVRDVKTSSDHRLVWIDIRL